MRIVKLLACSTFLLSVGLLNISQVSADAASPTWCTPSTGVSMHVQSANLQVGDPLSYCVRNDTNVPIEAYFDFVHINDSTGQDVYQSSDQVAPDQKSESPGTITIFPHSEFDYLNTPLQAYCFYDPRCGTSALPASQYKFLAGTYTMVFNSYENASTYTWLPANPQTITFTITDPKATPSPSPTSTPTATPTVTPTASPTPIVPTQSWCTVGKGVSIKIKDSKIQEGSPISFCIRNDTNDSIHAYWDFIYVVDNKGNNVFQVSNDLPPDTKAQGTGSISIAPHGEIDYVNTPLQAYCFYDPRCGTSALPASQYKFLGGNYTLRFLPYTNETTGATINNPQMVPFTILSSMGNPTVTPTPTVTASVMPTKENGEKSEYKEQNKNEYQHNKVIVTLKSYVNPNKQVQTKHYDKKHHDYKFSYSQDLFLPQRKFELSK